MSCRSLPQDHFDQLLELSQNNPGLSNVCVPYLGRDWKGGPRVMVCGKAPYGWDDTGNTLTDQCHNVHRFVEECVVPGHYRRSHFWRYAWEIISACLLGAPYENTEEQRRQLAGHLYWTNLAKVGGEQGNLPGGLLRAHAPVFTSILLGEITRMAPRAVVFATGSYGERLIDTIVEKVAGRAFCWTEEDPYFWHYTPERRRPILIWTRHPQGWTARQWAAGRIAELLR